MPTTVTRSLQAEQNRCLRVVCGVYKATPIQYLEKEATIPLLQIYLNKRVIDFEMQLSKNGKLLLDQACAHAASIIANKRMCPLTRTEPRLPPCGKAEAARR